MDQRIVVAQGPRLTETRHVSRRRQGNWNFGGSSVGTSCSNLEVAPVASTLNLVGHLLTCAPDYKGLAS